MAESTREKSHLFIMGILSVGFVGYFALQESWVGYVFAHLTALGIMGFYGSLAGWIAHRKGYSYTRAFKVGFLLSLCMGVLTAFIFAYGENTALPLTCGGWTVLFTGLVVVIFYSLLRNRMVLELD